MAGFSCVLGNPPWEHTELKEKEWFAERDPCIASAPTGATRKRMIDELKRDNSELFRAFKSELRAHDAVGLFLGDSHAYPLCGRGRINLFAVFAELQRRLAAPTGRAGMVVPSGIATDDTTKYFFQDLVKTRSLASLYDFENKGIFFPDVHSSFKFSLLTAGSGARPLADQADFVFFAHSLAELTDPDRRLTLSPEDIALINPNTRTCPIFRGPADAELTKAVYRRVPVLIREACDGQPEENPWGITFRQGLFNMTSDSHLFRTREQLETEGWQLIGNVFHKQERMQIPLYEAKMTNIYDHRHGSIVGSNDVGELSGIPAVGTTLDQHKNPDFYPLPRYWVEDSAVDRVKESIKSGIEFFIATRDVARSTDIRSAIQAIIPFYAVGHKSPLVFCNCEIQFTYQIVLSCMNSYVFDYFARQKMGGAHLGFYIMKQIPVVRSKQLLKSISDFEFCEFINSRVLELSYTSWDLFAFAKHCNCHCAPFRWDEDRRFEIRCELDAAFFRLYLLPMSDGHWRPARVAEGAVRDETDEELAELTRHFPTPRHAVEHILDSFPIVRRKDEEAHGEFRTKRVILEIYDEMAEAMRTGRPYQTRLDPPPADPRCCHPPRESSL